MALALTAPPPLRPHRGWVQWLACGKPTYLCRADMTHSVGTAVSGKHHGNRILVLPLIGHFLFLDLSFLMVKWA